MHGCQSSNLPSVWLMTDPRFGDRLLPSIQKLPMGSGVVFRHYNAPNRFALSMAIAKISRRRGLKLIIAGDDKGGMRGCVKGYYYGRPHKSSKRHMGIILVGVHDVHEINRAKSLGADAYFLSPVFSTISHKGQRPLGLLRFRQLCHLCDKPVIALGGMNLSRFQSMKYAHGYAAIDGLID